MFGFLSFLLILFLLIIFIGFSILGNIMRVLFGVGKRRPYSQNQTSDKDKDFAETSSSSSSHKRSHSSENRKKIFDDNEGEYVDYEEIK